MNKSALPKANRTEIEDEENDIFAEVDALLENGGEVIAVEIKFKPKQEDIDGHIERMEKLRRYADPRNDGRGCLGAIAGAVFSKSEKIYALKNGFYVIEPSGDTFSIAEPKGAHHPREWLTRSVERIAGLGSARFAPLIIRFQFFLCAMRRLFSE